MTKLKTGRMCREEQYQVGRSMRLPFVGIGQIWNQFNLYDRDAYEEAVRTVITDNAEMLGPLPQVLLKSIKRKRTIRIGTIGVLELLFRLGTVLNEVYAANQAQESHRD